MPPSASTSPPQLSPPQPDLTPNRAERLDWRGLTLSMAAVLSLMALFLAHHWLAGRQEALGVAEAAVARSYAAHADLTPAVLAMLWRRDRADDPRYARMATSLRGVRVEVETLSAEILSASLAAENSFDDVREQLRAAIGSMLAADPRAATDPSVVSLRAQLRVAERRVADAQARHAEAARAYAEARASLPGRAVTFFQAFAAALRS